MSKQLGLKIIEMLNTYSDLSLPEFGVLAGQSVAEAYFRIKNIPVHTRVKDLDLFVNMKNDRYRAKYEAFTRNYKSLKLSSPHQKEKIVKKDSSFAGDDIEAVERESKTYDVIDTFDLGMINVVEVEFDIHSHINHSEFLKATIGTFDINAIEIGVCLKTKRVFMSKGFKAFLKTKQVSITTFYRPARTIVRYLEKSQFYLGAYFNFEYEVNLLLSHYLLNDYKNNRKLTGVKLLKGNYHKLTDKNKKILGKYFKVYDQSFEPLKIHNLKFKTFSVGYDSDKSHYYSEYKSYLSVQKLHNYLKMNPDDLVDIIAPKFNYFIPRQTQLVSMFKESDPYLDECIQDILAHKKSHKGKPLTKKMRKFKINTSDRKNQFTIIASKTVDVVYLEPKLRVFSKATKENLYYIRQSAKRTKMFAKLMPFRDFQILLYNNKKTSLVHKYMKGFKSLHLDDLVRTCMEQEIDFAELFQLEKNTLKAVLLHNELTSEIMRYHKLKNKPFSFKVYGEALRSIAKSDHRYTIGHIENGDLSLDFIYKSAEEIAQFFDQKKKNEKVKIKSIDKEYLSFGTYKINHVDNTFRLREVGNEMNHCVGGYSEKLRSGSMLFFDIYDQSNKRYTLSVNARYKKDIKLKMDQLKMNSNVRPPKKVTQELKKFIVQLEVKINEDALLVSA